MGYEIAPATDDDGNELMILVRTSDNQFVPLELVDLLIDLYNHDIEALDKIADVMELMLSRYGGGLSD